MDDKRLAPVHPGEVLLEEYMAPLSLSQNRLALETGIPAPRINAIVRGRRSITADTALRLARFFGNSARFWLNLQAQYDLEVAEDALGERLAREVRPLPAPQTQAEPDGPPRDRMVARLAEALVARGNPEAWRLRESAPYSAISGTDLRAAAEGLIDALAALGRPEAAGGPALTDDLTHLLRAYDDLRQALGLSARDVAQALAEAATDA